MAASIVVYGADECKDTIRVREFLTNHGVPFQYVNIDQDHAAEEKVKHWNKGKRITPTVEFTVGMEVYRLANPGNKGLEEELEANEMVGKAS